MDRNQPGSMTLLIDDLASPMQDVRDEAAHRIWERYGPRLLGLVRDRLDRRLRGRVDEEDVAQSAYLSFCMSPNATRTLGSRVELWRLLARITIRKVCNAANHHRAIRRDYRRETPPPDDAASWSLDLEDPGVVGVEEASVVAELIESLPSEELRHIALWRLEGLTNEEIARRIDRTVRSVEIKLQRIRSCFSALDPS